MKNAISLVRAGEKFWLLPERAVWWPSPSVLFLADLHWGKEVTFQSAGIPLPDGMIQSDLKRMENLVESLHPQKLVILGDLVHAANSLSPGVIERVADWRRGFRGEFILVKGNHDRRIRRWPLEWNMQVTTAPHPMGPIEARHEPPIHSTDTFSWCGHYHPTHTLSSGNESLRLPCFQVSRRAGVLPAFSRFTNGRCGPLPGRPARIFVIADGQVLAVRSVK